jgi:hypothetical protein
MRKLILLLAGALLLVLTSCSETPQTVAKKEPEKPAEPVTGESALFKMFQVAKSWSRDAEILKLNSVIISEFPDVPRGKAAVWEAQFVSTERSGLKSYTYSIADVPPSLHKGVFAGPESSWSGPKGGAPPIRIEAIHSDTDAAYKTALENSGDYDKKNPGKPITIILERTNRFPDPVWRVIWGESAGTSNFSVFVNATTGKYLEKMH